ncbi:hypothetical protein DRQ09_10130, partial [candidate division KSB1 bacterium]
MVYFIFLSFLIATGSVYLIMCIIFFAGLSRKKTERWNNKEFVSVIIAVRDEEKNIRDCLECLIKQTYPEELYEIIVVDDNSSDSTSMIVEDFCSKHKNVFLYRLDRYKPGFSPKKQAITLGIEKSKGEIILTTDADCRVKKGWIESMISGFTKNTGMVAGFSQVEREKRFNILNIIQQLDFLSLMTAAAGSISIGIPFAVSGQNLAYRKKAFWEVGGFNSIFDRVSGDDVLLMQIIRKKTDWKIKFNFYPESFVTTKGEKKLRDLLNQRKRWASNSKVLFSLDKGFFFYLVDVFLFNLLILIGILFCIFVSEIRI